MVPSAIIGQFISINPMSVVMKRHPIEVPSSQDSCIFSGNGPLVVCLLASVILRSTVFPLLDSYT